MGTGAKLTTCILLLSGLLAADLACDAVPVGAAPRSRTEAPEPKPPPRLPERATFARSDQDAAVVPGMPQARFWGDSEPDFLRAVATSAGPWLMLSSGGADGAYGAGILSGWTEAGTRPEFSVVTGVSTGAMIAPFAFVGPRYDERLRKLYSTLTAADVFEVRGTGESMFDTWPLKDLLAREVTPELLADVAAEHRRGRRLFVVTTDLDAERPVVWNMGEIALRGDDTAVQLFREVLLASGSIPGMFPPVYIDVEANGRHFQEMHADGGMGGTFYVAPALLLSDPRGHRLPATELYVIVNGKLAPEFQVTERNTLAILGRSIATTLKTAARMELAQTYQYAQRSGIGFNVAAIDDNFDKQSRGSFDPDYMHALVELGADQVKAGSAFRRRPPDVASSLGHPTASCVPGVLGACASTR
jgi:Patatin-like phospholipase